MVQLGTREEKLSCRLIYTSTLIARLAVADGGITNGIDN
jgi:hypothetical protein